MRTILALTIGLSIAVTSMSAPRAQEDKADPSSNRTTNDRLQIFQSGTLRPAAADERKSNSLFNARTDSSQKDRSDGAAQNAATPGSETRH